jgi:proline iminopeptidase
MGANSEANPCARREGYAPVQNAVLYFREVGHGRPIILVHGGPDFDHGYLRPDKDRLSDIYRLIYYDQRGRGKSTSRTHVYDIGIETEIEDLDGLREYYHLDAVALLGHPWGGLLAMEYAIRHPHRVSHLILMNTAAASHEDYLVWREEGRRRKAPYERVLNELVSSAEFNDGDPDAVAAYYRIHFATTVKQPEYLERLLRNMSGSFAREHVLRARAIEERLFGQTWGLSEYDLFPKLKRLSIPTLVIHGDNDLIPAECAAHIARAIPGARFALLKETGHFAFMDSPDDVRTELTAFFDAG